MKRKRMNRREEGRERRLCLERFCSAFSLDTTVRHMVPSLGTFVPIDVGPLTERSVAVRVEAIGLSSVCLQLSANLMRR